MSRKDIFKGFKLALDSYMDSLEYVAPELRMPRNPVVLMHDMAKKVPEGVEYDQYVAGFVVLAAMATQVHLQMIEDEWWVPVSEIYLEKVIGPIDCDWKKQALAIWHDEDYTKDTIQ